MNVGRGEYQALLALLDSDRLRFLVRAYMTSDRLDEWFDRNLRSGDGDDMMRIGGVKFFADGALGSLTAWMLEPYDRLDGGQLGDVGFPLQPVERDLFALDRRLHEHAEVDELAADLVELGPAAREQPGVDAENHDASPRAAAFLGDQTTLPGSKPRVRSVRLILAPSGRTPTSARNASKLRHRSQTGAPSLRMFAHVR